MSTSRARRALHRSLQCWPRNFTSRSSATIAVDTTSEGVFEATSALLNANLASDLSADQAVSLNSRVWLVQATRSGFAPIAVFPTMEKDRRNF